MTASRVFNISKLKKKALKIFETISSGRRSDRRQVLRHLPDPRLLPAIQEEEGKQDGHRELGLRRGQGCHLASRTSNFARKGTGTQTSHFRAAG